MDNLIRSYNRVPIVHFDLGLTTANVDTSLNGESSQGETILHHATALSSTVTRPYSLAFKPSTSDKIQVQMKPNSNRANLYLLYEGFANEFLRESVEPPPSEGTHISRYSSDFRRYYWVPMSARDQFFNLSMVASVEGYQEERAKVAGTGSQERRGIRFEDARKAPEPPKLEKNSATEALESLREEVVRDSL